MKIKTDKWTKNIATITNYICYRRLKKFNNFKIHIL